MGGLRVVQRDQRGTIRKNVSRRFCHEEQHFLKNGAVSKKRVPEGNLWFHLVVS